MNRNLLTALAALVVLGACQSKGGTDESYEAHRQARLSQYGNVLIVCFNESPAREAWEDAVVAQLEATGRRATASYEQFPDLETAKRTEIQSYVHGRQMKGIVGVLVTAVAEVDRETAVVMGETSFHDVVAVEASATQVAGDIQLRAILFDCQSQTAASWKPVWAHVSEVFAAGNVGPDGVADFVAGALEQNVEL